MYALYIKHKCYYVIMLKWILHTSGGTVWSEFIWLRKWTCSGLL